MVTVWGYASGPGWCVSCHIVHTRTHMVDCTYTVFGPLRDRAIIILSILRVTLYAWKTCWLTDLSRPEGPYIYRLVSHILCHIRLHIYLRLLIRLHWYEPLCTDTSRSSEAYLHTPTAYQTDLSCEAHDAGTHATLRIKSPANPGLILSSPNSVPLNYTTHYEITLPISHYDNYDQSQSNYSKFYLSQWFVQLIGISALANTRSIPCLWFLHRWYCGRHQAHQWVGEWEPRHLYWT